MSTILLAIILVLSVLQLGLLALMHVQRQRSGQEFSLIQQELRASREEAANFARQARSELSEGLRAANEHLGQNLHQLGEMQRARLEILTQQNKEANDSSRLSLEQIRTVLDTRVKELQEGNEKRLEEMRKTVDERLEATLEKRLGESFKLVSERLEAVHKGLGEMQQLASGVGDLKKVLTNVKTRGTWGEVQLGAILEQMLSPEQFEKNVHPVAGSREVVEYAIRLPGAQGDVASSIWLPIDAKFPQEDYLRLQEASESGDPQRVQVASEALSRAVQSCAKDIHDKYVHPPETTDFAILFLATEGLYSEVLRHPDLAENLQRKYRVVLAGPTTLAAVLTSLRLGFQTLAIEQRAAEVWHILSAVKTEFGKFGAVLDKVKKHLDSASSSIDSTAVRTRAMQRHLRRVEELPAGDASRVFGDLAQPVEDPESGDPT